MSTDDQAAHDGRELVVVGSSAGGIGALSVFVGTLPRDFPAPVVLAQHLNPQRQSNLGSILERHSALPVVVVNDRAPMEPGKVYVVPSNRHVKIQDGEVYVEGDHEGRPRPSVDLLLSSAAKSYGESLIAVVLTGSGSDGAAGAVDVKNAGGTVIIQNPESAPYPSMPLSLPPTIVDHVAEIEQIGELLTSLLRGVRVVTAEKADDPLRALLSQVSRHTSIDFRNYKPTTILRRIARRMAVTRVHSLREYERYLDAHPEEVGELLRAFLIKVTGFFRDPEAYEFVRARVMPELLAIGREQGNVLRFWSAGCATGEEPYSLALLLSDVLGPELPEWSIKIFATDLDESAINFARRGVYPANVLGDLPDDYLVRYFEPFDRSFRIAKTLRQMVIFGQQDLSRGVPFPRIDLVVCRNLLIYLKPELQQTVLDLFAYSLHQTNGFLFLGKAETARPTKGTFDLVNKKWKIYRCKSGPVTLPQREGTRRLLKSVSDRPNILRPPAGYEKQMANTHELPALDFDIAHLRRFNELVLRHLPFGVVVIDRNYRILSVNGFARRLLGIRDIANAQDFLHAVRDLPYALVRQAIDTAFRERSHATLEAVELESAAGADLCFLNLSVIPIHAEGGGMPELAVVCVSDATELTRTRCQLEEARAEHERLAADLGSTNKRLSDVNKELQDANEELQAANEELMLTQEELQATNEEFEATNEELQATNEELETNNEELQATNEELQTTNDELSARTVELQDMTQQLTDEQNRLAEVIELAPYPTLVLRGRALVIEMYNQRYQRLFGGSRQVGRPLEEVFAGEEPDEFIRLVRECYGRDRATTTERLPFRLPGGRGEAAPEVVHTIIPLHDGGEKVDGIVVYTESAADGEGQDAAAGDGEK
jgi:two-component system, chemotaxis family, CheB/CheR fusion protein